MAIRETWQQDATGREVPAGAFLSPAAVAGLLSEPSGPASDPADLVLARIEHQRRVGDLRALKRREREALYLHGLGHTYDEIARLTASSYTAVNRRLTEGRARLRELLARRGDE